MISENFKIGGVYYLYRKFYSRHIEYRHFKNCKTGKSDITFKIKLFKISIDIFKIKEEFSKGIKNGFKYINNVIKGIVTYKKENNKKIKEHNKNVEKLERKHIKFE